MGDGLGDEQEQCHPQAGDAFDQKATVDLDVQKIQGDFLDEHPDGKKLGQVIVDGFEAFTVGDPEIEHHTRGGNRHRQKEVDDELIEGQPHFGPDDDVGRVAH